MLKSLNTWKIAEPLGSIGIERVISIIEGSLEAKLPKIWRDENAVQLSSRSEMEKVRREKMQVREKVGKSRNPVFFPLFCGSGGSKSRLAEAAGEVLRC